MRHYIRKVDKIDRQRGDLLSLRLQDVVPLFSESYPAETRHALLDALLGWFVGGEEPKIEDPITDAYLQLLVTRQKESVNRFLEKCNINRENVVNGKIAKAGQRGVTAVPNRTVKEYNRNRKVNRKDEPKSESLRFTDAVVDGSGADADAAPEPPPPTVTATEAKRTIQDIAPEVTKDNYDPPAIKYYNDNYVGVWLKSDTSIATRAAFVVNESYEMWTRQFLRNSCRKLGRDLFARAVFRMDRDLQKPGGSDIENPGAVLVTRLKRLEEAVDALSATSDSSAVPGRP